MKCLYIVATGQHVGKTTISLGLVGILQKMGLRVHFIKPVGQQYILVDGLKIDKDSVLMKSTYGLEGDLSSMSAITVPSGFVENYINAPDPAPLRKAIYDSYEKLSAQCDILVVEGTGHAGVGSCFDLSNADVASMLKADAILVAPGGIGRTIDEVALNFALLESRQVKLLGIIANKIIPEKKSRIKESLGRGLSNLNLNLAGVIPFEKELTIPRVSQIAAALKAEVLCGSDALDARIEDTLVAAMEPQNVLARLHPNSLMITSGDRVDNILVALHARGGVPGQGSVRAIALTGGLMPPQSIIDLMKSHGLPVLICQENTFPVAATVRNEVYKILPEDHDKITLAQELVREHVDVDGILSAATSR